VPNVNPESLLTERDSLIEVVPIRSLSVREKLPTAQLAFGDARRRITAKVKAFLIFFFTSSLSLPLW
jgi:hypothetical protein